jgi:predicted amidohydrolase
MKVYGLQYDVAWENKSANFATVRRMVAALSPEPDSLLALPEMFATGFSMNTQAIAEATGGETEQFLAALAKEYRIAIIGGVAQKHPEGSAQNMALAFSSTGGRICSYAKQRPFSPGAEDQHYKAGDGCAVFRLGNCTIAPFICYDLRFPELFRAAAAAHRPGLFLVIANFPTKRISHWIQLLRARAIENQAYVLGVSRVGNDPFYEYCGRSLLVDPLGEIVSDGGESAGVVQGELNFETLAKYRAGLPFLNDLKWPPA